ncbi:nuclease NucT [Helicobacter pylori]|uniref:phospholipase D-like domain-containing protein n=1 Tax=Helicobacter pylori TaxID=210 RepID=UPI0004D613BB|nr:phospholipase D-like domain-containing protein [Helicobacter pylori]KEY39094.1 nuclease NucT [Helicobacter pylori]OOQ15017.1 nuclease NucT [Helicobacter pylori]PDW48331.1 nuclease NucT [Helicobacter pylori]
MLNKFKKIVGVGVLVSCLGVLQAKNSLFVLPYEQRDALNSLISGISSARESVKIAIYSFTHRDIARAIKSVASRGIKVQIIYDYESNHNNKQSTIGYLDKYPNTKVCLLKGLKAKNGNYYGIMHQKVAIIDDKIVFLGSANWSKNAFENNYEVLLKTDDTKTILKAKSYYQKMLESCVGF